jgi:hypothetical protein
VRVCAEWTPIVGVWGLMAMGEATVTCNNQFAEA